MIGPMTRDHVRQVADLHCESLTGLLTMLGRRAAEAFYTGSVRSSLAIGLVDTEGAIVRGFVLGSLSPAELRNDVMKRNPIGTIAGIISGVVKTPSSLEFLLKSFRGPDDGGFDPTMPELTYIAVAPEYRGTGVGVLLVNAFTNAVQSAGSLAYELSVDEDNERAIAFYEGIDFRPTGHYREFARTYRRYKLQSSRDGHDPLAVRFPNEA